MSTAVQLERLEEIERALAELDPDQFVRKADAAGAPQHDSSNGDLAADPTTSENPSESNLSSW